MKHRQNVYSNNYLKRKQNQKSRLFIKFEFKLKINFFLSTSPNYTFFVHLNIKENQFISKNLFNKTMKQIIFFKFLI